MKFMNEDYVNKLRYRYTTVQLFYIGDKLYRFKDIIPITQSSKRTYIYKTIPHNLTRMNFGWYLFFDKQIVSILQNW